MPLATEGQSEGFAYFGLGFILLIFILGYNEIFNQRNKIELKNGIKKLFPFFYIIILFFLFSVSPVITLNQYIFLPPDLLRVKPVEQVWGIFRSTGRMTWSIVYIVMIYCFSWAIKRISVKKSIFLLSILLFIQWTDLKPWFTGKGNSFKTKFTYQSILHSPVWNELANEHKHIFFMDDPLYKNGQRVLDYSYSFLDMAANFGMTVNDAYLARKNADKINENKSLQLINLLKGEPRNDTVYVFMNDNEQINILKEAGLYIYFIDNIYVVLNTNKYYLEGYRFE